jgi:LPXTG-site transpeptidase (sortase) family protein
MSGQSSHESDQKTIPLGIVFLVIGFIILGTVAAIWVLIPAWMPQPLYAFLDEMGVVTAVAPIPTPISPAQLPAITLLPETPTEGNPEDLPDYFVSIEDAAKRSPTSGQPTWIIIPQINLDAPVSEIGLTQITNNGQTYYQWQVPNEFRVGWHNNSARLGQPGNTVLNGHHNIYGEVFRDLIDLNEGDKIILYDSENSYTYQVTIKKTLAERDQPMSVRIENAQWIAPTEDERITLITCWPYTDNSHRLVIVAEPVKDL